jgi:hypothetical protein
MYKPGDQFPIVEEDAVADTNDARQIEVYLAGTGLPYTFFRPQVGLLVRLVDGHMLAVPIIDMGSICVSIESIRSSSGLGDDDAAAYVQDPHLSTPLSNQHPKPSPFSSQK